MSFLTQSRQVFFRTTFKISGISGQHPSLWLLLQLMIMVTTGARRRAKLQSNRHHQQTNTQFFYRPDALPTTKTITVSLFRVRLCFHMLMNLTEMDKPTPTVLQAGCPSWRKRKKETGGEGKGVGLVTIKFCN